ncbi:MAG: hypothetical protein E7376_04535 [Clostridiales bacterium]|nr:hypothetical protein [Clostridiales bacterium]
MSKIEQWIEEGKIYIYPQKHNNWVRCVYARVADLYSGVELDIAIEIMKKLQNGETFKSAKKYLQEQKLTGFAETMVDIILVDFCKQEG